MTQTITALYADRVKAGFALDELVREGVPTTDITMLMSEPTHGKEFSVEVHTKAPEGAATGAAIGGTIGAIAAGMTAVGAVALTGGAGLIAVGPLVAALAGAGAGGAAGGVVGGLVGLGFDENEAKLVDHDLGNGSIMLAVQVPDDRSKDFKKTLENSGAKHITLN